MNSTTFTNPFANPLPKPLPNPLENPFANPFAIQEDPHFGLDDEYCWSWYSNEFDEWIPFEDRINGVIERAYFNGEGSVVIDKLENSMVQFLIGKDGDESVYVIGSRRYKVQRDPPKTRQCKIVWEWHDGSGWTLYDQQATEVLEKSYVGGLDYAILNEGFFARDGYKVDLNTMKQLNLRSFHYRDVRRTAKFGDSNRQGVETNNETPECPICFQQFPTSEIVAHVNYCLEKTFGGDQENNQNPNNTFIANSANVVIDQDDYDPVTKEVFDCPICLDDITPGNGYQFEECGHKYCCECLNGFYSELIRNGKISEIKCPNPECTYECSYDDIRFVVSKEELDKYVEFKKNAMINADPEMRWCPNPTGCGNAFRRPDPKSKRMLCDKCNYEFCFDCQEEYHGKQTCAEFARWKVANNRIDIRVYLWQKLNTKGCPSCQAKIQKKGGCNHMTCYSCNHEFCWLCLKEYTSGHYDNSWCTQYGKGTSLHYAKVIGKKLVHALPFLSYSSSYDSSDSSDNETLGEKFEAFGDKLTDVTEELGEKLTDVTEELGEKLDDVKIEMAEKWQNTKQKATATFVRFKSLFDK